MPSIQRRLLLGTVTGTTALFLVSGIVLHIGTRAALLAEFDESLGATARALSALVEVENDEAEIEFNGQGMPEFGRRDRPQYFQLWGPGGVVWARSPSLGGGDLAYVPVAVGLARYAAVTLPNGQPGRQVTLAFRPRSSDDDEAGRGHAANRSDRPIAVLAVARDTADVDGSLIRLGRLLFLVGAAAVVLTAGILAVVVRHGLGPLRRLAARIGELDAGNLSERIDLPHAPAELAPIVDRLNALLTRLDAAFQRERTFSADAAHELRTPLAGLRSTFEVALTRDRNAAEYREAIAGGLRIAQEMQAVTDNLLALARIEAGQMEIESQPADLVGLLHETWRPFAARAEARGVRVRWRADGPCVATVDAGKLRQVLQNVFDNAVSYVNDGGEILIEALRENGTTTVRVSNTGSRVSAGDVGHVFERFWRGDPSRADTGAHCGLGLPLCQRMMEMLGGTITAESTRGGTFVASLSFSEDRMQSRRSPGGDDRPAAAEESPTHAADISRRRMLFFGFFFKIRGLLVVLPLFAMFFETRGQWDNPPVNWAIGLSLFGAAFALRIRSQQFLRYRLREDGLLATTGPYAWVRNPVYLANATGLAALCIMCGLYWMAPLAAAWALLAYHLAVQFEEMRLLKRFGEPYRLYLERVPRWIPRRAPVEDRGSGHESVLKAIRFEWQNLLLPLVPLAKEWSSRRHGGRVHLVLEEVQGVVRAHPSYFIAILAAGLLALAAWNLVRFRRRARARTRTSRTA